MEKTGHNSQTLEKVDEELREPPLYRVVMMNDDYTTRDFVIDVLVRVFHKDVPAATRIMLDVHRKGRGIVGTYTRDIALTKVQAVHHMAREADFPLRCVVEEA